VASADNSLAGASDTTGEPLARRYAEEAVEIHPITMYGKGDLESEAELYDFVPREEEEVVGLEDEDEGDMVGPKASSAPGSALYELYQQTQTPMPMSDEKEKTAAAERGSTSDEDVVTGSESSTPTSSTTQQPTSGSETPPAPSQE
jgi:hypothetical protein